jgi:hypothetical protein
VLFLAGITKGSYSDSVDEFVITARARNLHPPRDKGHNHHHFAKLSITHTPFALLAAMVRIAPGQGRTMPVPVLSQGFLIFFLNNWPSRKPRLFRAIASAKRSFQREVEVTKLLGAFRYNLEE